MSALQNRSISDTRTPLARQRQVVGVFIRRDFDFQRRLGGAGVDRRDRLASRGRPPRLVVAVFTAAAGAALKDDNAVLAEHGTRFVFAVGQAVVALGIGDA